MSMQGSLKSLCFGEDLLLPDLGCCASLIGSKRVPCPPQAENCMAEICEQMLKISGAAVQSEVSKGSQLVGSAETPAWQTSKAENYGKALAMAQPKLLKRGYATDVANVLQRIDKAS